MSENLVEFSSKFNIDELKIFETKYWIWSLRPSQPTLGAGILSLKRKAQRFSELNKEEFCDLEVIIKSIENTLSTLFNYDKINYLMLMMVDKQVHYHVIPRYKDPVTLLDNKWIDKSWPGLPNLAEEDLGNDQLIKIVNHIKNNIKR